MKNAALLLLFSGLIVGATAAQPRYGDLLISNTGLTGYFDPNNPGRFTTLAVAPVNYAFHCGLRMAPDNVDVVVSQTRMNTVPWTVDLVTVDVNNGSQTTISAGGGGKYVTLDHDNKWISVAVDRPSLTRNSLYSIDHGTGAVVTCWSQPSVTRFEASTIDRDPGAGLPYVIASWGSPCSPRVLRVDRQGNCTTVLNCGSSSYVCAALHPRSGDALLGCWSKGALVRVTKTGAETTVVTGYGLNGIQITQDDIAWCATLDLSGYPAALKVDMSKHAVVTLVKSGSTSSGTYGIEVYGSRTMVCHQTGATVSVKVQSRHPLARGAHYFLAASPARRPGHQFTNGEWLDLDVTDPLFFVSALGMAPSIFDRFQGKLDAKGNATATVNIPSSLPKLNDLAIFVAGVIVQKGQVMQVTNSHWFVLP